jgi:hypothetical protein
VAKFWLFKSFNFIKLNSKIYLFLVNEEDKKPEEPVGPRPTKLVLLPRTKPIEENVPAATNSSIFGTGKPRDINKPEIKQLEERLDQLVVSKPQEAAPAQEGGEAKSMNSSTRSSSSSLKQNNNQSGGGAPVNDTNDRLRTTSTTSSNVSNK